jgi:hypothetical protein
LTAVDRLFSVFSLYDFVSCVLSGLAVIAGAWWAVAGVPDEPGTATVLALIAASYVVGHLVQAVAVLWEPRYWKLRGGWPSDARINADSGRSYAQQLRAFIADRLAADHGEASRDLGAADRFALARADLRAWGADARAELMNTLYALSRGLATASAVLILVFAAAWIDDGAIKPFGIATAGAVVATLLLMVRFDRFGFYFADQVWRDYAAGRPEHR